MKPSVGALAAATLVYGSDARRLDQVPGRCETADALTGHADGLQMGQGSVIDRTNPSFDDLGRREVINVRCKCGREVQIAPYQLIGKYGIQKHTKVWTLRDRFRCTKCRRRPPAQFWVAKWQD